MSRARRRARPIVPVGIALGGCLLCGFFVARFPMTDSLATVSAAFVLVFFAPSALAAARWLGGRRAAALLCGMGLYALALETVAVTTGIPYGRFSYGQRLGALLFGTTPWTVFFSWTPLALLGLTVARGRAPLAGALLVAMDLTLDPGAVAQGLWRYDNPGAYFGVPLANFAGWALTGTLGAALGRGLSAADWSDAPPTLALSGALILTFWTGVCAFSGLWIPAFVGTALLLVTFWRLR